MKTTDFTKTITSNSLKENLEKQFGAVVNLESYSREQLEDIRNKLRTKVFQQENAAGINDLLTNETYQKNKAMLDLLNTRIKEMLGEDIKKLRDKMTELSEAKKGVKAPKYKIHSKGTAGKDYDGDGKVETPKDEVWGSRKKAAAKAGKPFEESIEEGWDDMTADVKARSEKEKKEKGTGKFDVKKTATGTQYTRKSSTFTDGGDDSDVKAAKKKAKKADEGVMDTVKKVAKKVGKAITGPDDEELVQRLEKQTGGKRPSNIPTPIKAKESKNAKPDFLDADKDGNKKETMKKAMKDKKAVKESAFKHNVRFVNESLAFLINEDEEGKAKAITAASDMVNDFTSWMQRVGQYQTKSMIELSDAIRADFGQAEAEAFKQSIAPALAATLETLTAQREAISNAVAVLAGEAAPADQMGMEPGMDAGAEMPPEPGMDAAAPDAMNPDAGDEFGAADAAAGGPEASGRAMRESKFARKLAESHSIMSKLAK